MNEFVASWKGDVIGRSVLIAAGAGLVLYGAFKIFRLVYVPDLPPPQDRPSAIKGPMAFTEDDGALFRKLGRENDLQKLLGLILDNQVVMVIIRGASGAGKTSLLRAGLTHILAEKGVKYHYWEAVPTEPDKWLLHAIRETWLEDATKPSTLDELVNPSDGLGRQAHVIVLDQFEQLRGSKPIFRLLRKIAREAKPPHRITWVIAFREEFSKAMLALRNPETNQRIAEGLTIDELAKEAGAEARLLKPQLDRLAQRDARLHPLCAGVPGSAMTCKLLTPRQSKRSAHSLSHSYVCIILSCGWMFAASCLNPHGCDENLCRALINIVD